MAMKIQSPGALAPDFETPLSLLTACHDKVRHFAALSLKLAAHVEATGCDVVATDCETCKWQIEMSTSKRVEHPLSILAAALDVE